MCRGLVCVWVWGGLLYVWVCTVHGLAVHGSVGALKCALSASVQGLAVWVGGCAGACLQGLLCMWWWLSASLLWVGALTCGLNPEIYH